MSTATNLRDLKHSGGTAQQAPSSTFPAMLEKYKAEIARALPGHIKPERMARIALTAFRRTPKLGECDPRSVFAAVIQSAQLGLEPDTLGRAYLIPYEKRAKVRGKWETVAVECQFVPGWKGLVDLVNRSGNATVWTGAVFVGDDFDYALGDRPFVMHRPKGEDDDPSRITHVYAVGRVKGAEWPVIEVWPIARVWRHRDRYNKVGEKHYSYQNQEMYARKVALLQVLKYMPMTPELSTAITLNDAAEVGAQNLNVKDVIEGTWAPATTDEEPTADTQAADEKRPADEDTIGDPSTEGNTDGPTFEDAMNAVKRGDYDMARDLARNLPRGQIAHIEQAINERTDNTDASPKLD